MPIGWSHFAENVLLDWLLGVPFPDGMIPYLEFNKTLPESAQVAGEPQQIITGQFRRQIGLNYGNENSLSETIQYFNDALIYIENRDTAIQFRYCSIWDAPTGGNLIYVWDLGRLYYLNATDPIAIGQGKLAITQSGALLTLREFAKWWFGFVANSTPPPSLWIELYGDFVKWDGVSTLSYLSSLNPSARAQVSLTEITDLPTGNKKLSNTGPINLGVTTQQISIKSAALWDSQSGGRCIAIVKLTVVSTYSTSTPIIIPTGALTLEVI